LNDQQIFIGILKREMLYEGSKSEHHGMVLVLRGKIYKIVRIGQNPFQDDELEKLTDKKVEVEGELVDLLIQASKIKVL